MGELINGRPPEKVRFNIAECAYGQCLSECPYDSSDECTRFLMEDALVLIQHLEAQQPKWISVKDSLPEAFVSVLVQMPGEAPHPTVREGFISDDGIWCAGHFKREPYEVTHWAKMPEPPKENAHE